MRLSLSTTAIRYALVCLIAFPCFAFAQFGNPFGYDGSLDDYDFSIAPGTHSDAANYFGDAFKGSTTNRNMEFAIEFDANAEYDESVPSAWNKLNMIAWSYWDLNEVCGDMEPAFRQNYKMHAGWRFNTDRMKLEFALFYHEDNNWVAHYINDGRTLEDEGSQFHVTNYIQMHSGKGVLGMVLNGKALGIKRGSDYFEGTRQSYLKRLLYFGGTTPAPHQISASLHHVRYDEAEHEFQSRFNSAAWQQWNLTNFVSGNNYLFHASNTMEGSALTEIDPDYGNAVVYKCDVHPDQRMAFCIIDNGARIKFKAGNQVLLRPGFYAKPGSFFHGQIQSKSGKNIETPITPFDPVEANAQEVNAQEAGLIPIHASKADLEAQFSLTPNPAKDFVALENRAEEDMVVNIYTLHGTLMMSQQIKKQSTQNIYLKAFSKGTYFVHLLRNGEIVSSEKLMVQ
jgi:hypothetical protein